MIAYGQSDGIDRSHTVNAPVPMATTIVSTHERRRMALYPKNAAPASSPAQPVTRPVPSFQTAFI